MNVPEVVPLPVIVKTPSRIPVVLSSRLSSVVQAAWLTASWLPLMLPGSNA